MAVRSYSLGKNEVLVYDDGLIPRIPTTKRQAMTRQQYADMLPKVIGFVIDRHDLAITGLLAPVERHLDEVVPFLTVKGGSGIIGLVQTDTEHGSRLETLKQGFAKLGYTDLLAFIANMEQAVQAGDSIPITEGPYMPPQRHI